MNGDSSQDESIINHQKHINDKEDCKAMFLKYQKPLDNTMSLCVSFDLQKVLNTPNTTLPNKCYERKLPISSTKFKDLSDLCKNGIIPEK